MAIVAFVVDKFDLSIEEEYLCKVRSLKMSSFGDGNFVTFRIAM